MLKHRTTTAAIGIVATLLFTLVATLMPASRATAQTTYTTAKTCTAAGNVWIVVQRDYAYQKTGCATRFRTGLEALQSAGFTTSTGAWVSHIDGYVGEGDWYWSYWQGGTVAAPKWTYSELGATQSAPKAGTIEGWRLINWKAGEQKPPAWTPTIKTPARITTTATGKLGDHTGDGIADALGVDSMGRLQVYRGTTTGAFTYLGASGTGWQAMSYIGQINDITGDRRSDVLAVRSSDKSLWLHRSIGNGYFEVVRQVGRNWGGLDQILPVYNLAGGSKQYVVTRQTSDGGLFRYEITPTGLTNKTQIGWRWNGMRQIIGIGDFTGDGRADVLGMQHDGALWLYAGTTTGTLVKTKQVGRGWTGYRLALSPGDLTGDGRYDLMGVRKDGAVFAYQNRVGSFGAARLVIANGEDLRLLA